MSPYRLVVALAGVALVVALNVDELAGTARTWVLAAVVLLVVALWAPAIANRIDRARARLRRRR